MNPSFELSITKVDTRDARGSAVVAGFGKSYHGSGAVAFFVNHRGAAAAAFQPRWTSLVDTVVALNKDNADKNIFSILVKRNS